MRKKSKVVILFVVITFSTAIYNKLSAQNVDVRILQRLQEMRSNFGIACMQGLSLSAYILSFLLPLAEFGYALLMRFRRFTIAGVQASGGILLAIGISTVLKSGIKRMRPYLHYPNWISSTHIEGTYSFPSGHTTGAFATATTLALQFRKWYVIVPAYLWAGAVAYSRMYLGVHFPTDVLAGIILGIGAPFAVYYIQRQFTPDIVNPLSLRP